MTIPVERWVPVLIALLVVCERLMELVINKRNHKRLMARGAIESGAEHYPYMVALHTAWIATVIAWAAFGPARINVPCLVAYVLVQPLRAWVMLTLGPYWTTRIISVPNAPLVARGPYRFLKHPNYTVVVAEIALLPLALGSWVIAAIFSILNALMLWVRIRTENAALAQRKI